MNGVRENSPPGVFSLDLETHVNRKNSFWWSARMTYTICAFLAMFLHHCMRSAVNYSILCMVADTTKKDLSNINFFQNKTYNCENENDNDTMKELQPYGDLNWTRTQAVMFQGIFFYGYIVTMPIAGRLADVYGGKHLFVSSLTGEALIFMLIPICARSSFWLATVVRLCQGLISGCGTPALYQLFTVWAHPTERTAALAFGYSGFNIGNLVVYPVSSFLCKLKWDYIFYVFGILALAIGISFQWLVYNSIETHPRISPEEYEYLKAAQRQKSKSTKVPWKSILTCAPFYIFMITHFCHTFGVSMEAIMLPRFLKEAMSFPISKIGNISALVFTGAIISKIITVSFSMIIESNESINQNRFRKMLHLLCNMTAVVFIIGIVVLDCRQRWVVVGLWTCVSISTDIAFSGAYWPSLLYLAPSYSGLLMGIANCFGTSSAFLVPVVITSVAPAGASSQWDIVLIILAIVYCIDAFSFGLFGSTDLQPWGLRDESEAELSSPKRK